jgi:hypothetical protein
MLSLLACVSMSMSGQNYQGPRVVTPGEGFSAPSDAIVLFDGKDLSQWEKT